MSLARFLHVLFTRGEVVFRKAPVVANAHDTEALRALESGYKRYLLDLPGRPPPMQPETALKAAEVLRQSCWFMLNHDEDDDQVQRQIAWQGVASSPGDHYSADLTMRYAARVHRRAKALNPGDALVRCLEATLRRLPLSGVLCDIDEAPVGLNFGDHEGLMLLYAERYARHPKPGWCPQGRANEYIELVRSS
ncbi:MAG: hypothetical protein K8I27_00025 [Planctomycetes bacterium]|nr:hypothetical protein [Planctomycetota bacterium]